MKAAQVQGPVPQELYLGRLHLNPAHSEVALALADPYRMHQHLSALAPSSRLLYRVEGGSHPWVLLLAWEPFLVHRLPPGFGAFEAKSLTPRHLTRGLAYRFRLRANPARNEGKRRQPVLGRERQVAWLARALEERGGRLLTLLHHEDEGFLEVRKPDGNRFSVLSVLFEGILEVQDPQALWRAEAEGLGRAKAFGFGLLSLVPWRG